MTVNPQDRPDHQADEFDALLRYSVEQDARRHRYHEIRDQYFSILRAVLASPEIPEIYEEEIDLYAETISQMLARCDTEPDPVRRREMEAEWLARSRLTGAPESVIRLACLVGNIEPLADDDPMIATAEAYIAEEFAVVLQFTDRLSRFLDSDDTELERHEELFVLRLGTAYRQLREARRRLSPDQLESVVRSQIESAAGFLDRNGFDPRWHRFIDELYQDFWTVE